MVKYFLPKKIYIPLIIFFLSIVIFISYLYAHSSLPPAIVEPGSMVTEADYIIFTDGTNYYARNGNTGKIEFNGDPTLVIQSAINALSEGTVFLKSLGTVNVGTITAKSNVSLIGDENTILKNSDGLGPIIEIVDQTNIVIKGLKFDGNDAIVTSHSLYNSAIKINGGKNIVIENVDITACEGHSITINKGENIRITKFNIHDTSQKMFGMDAIVIHSGRNIEIYSGTFRNIRGPDNYGGSVEIMDSQDDSGWFTENISVHDTFSYNIGEFAFGVNIPSPKTYRGYPKNISIFNNLIIDSGIVASGAGVVVTHGKNIKIYGNNIIRETQGTYGIYIFNNVEEASIGSNTIKNYGIGIYLVHDMDHYRQVPISINDNNILGGIEGIHLEYLNGGEVVGNTITGSQIAIKLVSVGQSNIVGNKLNLISGKSTTGIELYNSWFNSLKMNYLHGYSGLPNSIVETGNSSDCNIISENILRVCPVISTYGSCTIKRNNDLL